MYLCQGSEGQHLVVGQMTNSAVHSGPQPLHILTCQLSRRPYTYVMCGRLSSHMCTYATKVKHGRLAAGHMTYNTCRHAKSKPASRPYIQLTQTYYSDSIPGRSVKQTGTAVLRLLESASGSGPNEWMPIYAYAGPI